MHSTPLSDARQARIEAQTLSFDARCQRCALIETQQIRAAINAYAALGETERRHADEAFYRWWWAGDSGPLREMANIALDRLAAQRAAGDQS